MGTLSESDSSGLEIDDGISFREDGPQAIVEAVPNGRRIQCPLITNVMKIKLA